MPEYIRVRVKDTGAEHTIAKPSAVAEDVFEVLDEDAADVNGEPLPPKIADSKPQPEGYEAATVAEIKAEIDRRNADRKADDQISTQGNKPDLIAALVADDQKES